MKADLRSDTITKPDAAMLEAMVQAEVGDDCYQDDPTVNALEDYCAELLGKEAALFTCSGTMSNQLALRIHTAPGDEVLIEQNYHINFFESGAASSLAQVALNTIRTDDGILTPEIIQAAIDIKPRSPIYSSPGLICLENTMAFYGGKVFPLEKMDAIRVFAANKNLKIHLDGARLLHACIASGHTPAEYCARVDTVSLCFAKGLGAPFGSILAGSRRNIDRAKIFRKWYGGGLHQAGYMAAAALYALKNNYKKLADDHHKAKVFHQILSTCPAIGPVQDDKMLTNIVLFDIKNTGLCSKKFVEIMERNGVRLFPWPGTQVRAMTHMDISLEDVSWAAHKIVEIALMLTAERLSACTENACVSADSTENLLHTGPGLAIKQAQEELNP